MCEPCGHPENTRSHPLYLFQHSPSDWKPVILGPLNHLFLRVSSAGSFNCPSTDLSLNSLFYDYDNADSDLDQMETTDLNQTHFFFSISLLRTSALKRREQFSSNIYSAPSIPKASPAWCWKYRDEPPSRDLKL